MSGKKSDTMNFRFNQDTSTNVQKYYVKEKEPPTSGTYGKDKQVYTCTLTHEGYNDLDEVAGRTENKNVSLDLPLNDPVNILLQKVDADTGEPVPQGGGQLKGAKFTVRYYDTQDTWSLSKDYATRVKAATRTWVYETDENGAIDLRTSSPLNGSDAIYTDSEGQTVMPIGTYVLEETEPPTGYNMPDCQGRTFIEVVKPGNTENGESINTYHHETYKPISTEGDYKGLGWNEW